LGLTDHLGSIRDVIDGSAVVKDSITYDGFGNITPRRTATTAGGMRGPGGRSMSRSTCDTTGRGITMPARDGGSAKTRSGLMRVIAIWVLS
jgi:hypothetical protein